MNKYLVAAATAENPIIEIHSLTANSIHDAEQKIINYFVQNYNHIDTPSDYSDLQNQALDKLDIDLGTVYDIEEFI